MTTHSRFYSNMLTKLLLSADDTTFIKNPYLNDCRKIVYDIIIDAERNEKDNRTKFYRVYHALTNRAWSAYNAGKDVEYLYYLRLINIANIGIQRNIYKYQEDTNELHL